MLKGSVAIIGAGPSGLVSGKEALSENLEPFIFEKSSHLGGLWNQHQRSGIWSNMKTNVSKYTTCFSDFEWPDTVDLFPKSAQVNQYLINYTQNFKLNKHIHYNCLVHSVQQSGADEKWLIKWTCLSNNEEKSRKFDFLIVSSGIFSDAFLPYNLSLENFKGEILHSKKYDSNKFKGKKILVVGGAFSATEICTDLVESDESNLVVNVINRAYWLLPRQVPVDLNKPSELYPNDFVFYKMKEFFSANIIKKASNRLSNNYFSKICVKQAELSKESPLYMSSDSDEPPRVVISDNYLNYYLTNKIIVKKCRIVRFDECGVYLQDESYFKVDAVIFATGFRLCLDFFNEKIKDCLKYDELDQLQPVCLYKSTFHNLLKNAAFVGVYRGPFYGCVELQARWAMQVFGGKVSLPTDDVVLNGINEELEIRRLKPRPQFPHGDYLQFAKSIANEFGAMPNLNLLNKNDKELIENFMVEKNMMMTPALLRLNEKPKYVLEFIKRLYNQINE